jgi:hypothetical protein
MSEFSHATYSLEDNTLRLYRTCRQSPELFDRILKAGFRNAPKQGCYFAIWTPKREDLCIELGGEIEEEESSVLDRAEAKAERLSTIATNQQKLANNQYQRADTLSQRFYMGQPILVGHHSERSARATQSRMHNAMRNSIDATNKSQHYSERADSVLRHAQRKGSQSTRLNRIKKIMADMRSRQRDINHFNLCLLRWEAIATIDNHETLQNEFESLIYSRCDTGSPVPMDFDDDLRSPDLNKHEFALRCVERYRALTNLTYFSRWISHYLQRLEYEREQLPTCPVYEGEMTATIIRTFAREQGAHKPEVSQSGDDWILSSEVDLPAHMCQGKTISLRADQWREAMQTCGHIVTSVAVIAPILNFQASSVECMERWGNDSTVLPVITMTKEKYNAIYSSSRGIRVSKCGTFRVRVCSAPGVQRCLCKYVAVYLSDSKTHPVPDSKAIGFEEVQA